MKRLNNKGITTIEVIISFVIVIIISASLYTTVSNYNQKRLIEGYKSKIYSYKNLVTKTIQDDLIKIGLTHASYGKEHTGPKIVHTVNFDMKDGSKRKLIVTQIFTNSTYHNGDPNVDDYFMIQYGEEEKGELLEYPLPNIGQSKSESNRVVYDLSINNVLINIQDENILSIYIGFYHPELMTRYGINIVCPIDFVSKGVDSVNRFNVREPTKTIKKYSFNVNGGSGVINTISATVGEAFTLPDRGSVSKEGYTLEKWSTRQDGTGISYQPGQSIVPASNTAAKTELFAIWKKATAKEFGYTGSTVTYTIPSRGRYKLEVWGAQGGSYDSTYYGGYGAYATGDIFLNAGDKLYISVGAEGKSAPKPISSTFTTPATFNGGGKADATKDCDNFAASGGGATHIASQTGQLSSLSSNVNTIYIVAAGGGGASARICSTSDWHKSSGGNGGGIKGGSPKVFDNSGWTYTYPGGGSQTAGGSAGLQNNESGATAGTFGKGGSWSSSTRSKSYTSAIGGGGGFYGGGGGMFIGGGGGSSYIGNPQLINKIMYCYQCETSPNEATKTNTTNNASEDPKSNFAKKGNGYAKITFISD